MAATAGDEKSPCGLPRHSAGHRGLVGKQGEAEGSSHLHGKMGPLASSEPLLWGNALHPFDFQLFRFLSCYFLFITQKRHTFVWRFCCASFSSTHFGAAGEIRTLGTLLAYTRFPVVLVMTTSILLRIVMLDSENHYIKKLTKVKPKFKKYTIFCAKPRLAIFAAIFYTDKKSCGEGTSWKKTSIAP